jgi:hypothetical protein
MMLWQFKMLQKKTGIKHKSAGKPAVNNLDELVTSVHETKTTSAAQPVKTIAQGPDLETAIEENRSASTAGKISTSEEKSATKQTEQASLDELVKNTHTKKTRPQPEGFIITEHAADGGFIFSSKNRFIFRYILIVFSAVSITLASIYYLSKDLASVVQTNVTPDKMLERIDRELIIYQQQRNQLPKELDILISFPANAVEWPFQYRMIQNIEGKPEIMIDIDESGGYTLYYRLHDEMLMKPKAMPVQKIQVLP